MFKLAESFPPWSPCCTPPWWCSVTAGRTSKSPTSCWSTSGSESAPSTTLPFLCSVGLGGHPLPLLHLLLVPLRLHLQFRTTPLLQFRTTPLLPYMTPSLLLPRTTPLLLSKTTSLVPSTLLPPTPQPNLPPTLHPPPLPPPTPWWRPSTLLQALARYRWSRGLLDN